MTTKLISREPTIGMREVVLRCYVDDGHWEVFKAMFDAVPPSLNPWVSVKERLPTKEEAAEDGAGLLFTGKNIGFFYGSYDEQQKVFEWDMYAYGLDEVSHFMPIPRPEE